MGDLALIDAKWYASVGATQNRCLRKPGEWGGDARFRVREEQYPFNPDGTVNVERVIRQFECAWGISEGGTRFDKWSVHPESRHNREGGRPDGAMIETAATRRYWLHRNGGDQPLRTGHERAHLWFAEEAQ